jgi:hypothetical protein
VGKSVVCGTCSGVGGKNFRGAEEEKPASDGLGAGLLRNLGVVLVTTVERTR